MIDHCLQLLAEGPVVIRAALHGVGVDEARFRPAPQHWSIVEIINHLADEETEDFRTRLRLTLESPDAPWPPIDPQAAARLRAYQDRDFGESLSRFCANREESILWLQSKGLSNEALAIAPPPHPKAGILRAGDLLASWAAHDLLHLRQITRRRYEYLQRTAAPYGTAYAGSW